MEALIPLLSIFKDPVNMVLILVIIGMGWFIKTTRTEDRQDREKILAAIEKLDETLNAFRIAMSADHGKPM